MGSDDQTGAKRRGRPSLPEDDRRSTHLKFRTRPGVREKIEEAATANGRSASEEVEARLERTFLEENMAVSLYKRIAREAVYSAFEEYETRIGHRDGFSFGYWMGKALADAIKELKPLFPKDSIWYDDPKLLGIIKAAAQKQLDFLFEDYRRVEYVGNRIEAFEAVWPIILGNSESGEYERRAAAARVQREAEEAEQDDGGEA